jgi:hypothetical protein
MFNLVVFSIVLAYYNIAYIFCICVVSSVLYWLDSGLFKTPPGA